MPTTAPSYEDIVAQSNPAKFPTWALEGVETAVACYVSKWHGRQDVIHLAQAGARNVQLVDVRGMDEMERVYGPVFDDKSMYCEKPAYEALVLRDLLSVKADVVTLDPDTGQMPWCWEHEVPLAFSIAPRVIVGYCPAAFDTAGDIEAHARSIAPENVGCVELLKRSNYRGGVYWAVLERE